MNQQYEKHMFLIFYLQSYIYYASARNDKAVWLEKTKLNQSQLQTEVFDTESK